MVLIAFVYSNAWCVLQRHPLERADFLAGFVWGMVSPAGYLSNRAQPYSTHPWPIGSSFLSIRLHVMVPAGAGHAWTNNAHDQ